MEDLLGLGLDSTTPPAPATQPTVPPQVQQSPAPIAPAPQTTIAPPATNTAPSTTEATTNSSSTSSPPSASLTTPSADITATPASTSAANSSAMFVMKQEEPSTPELKEIQAKFGGRWKLVRSDPYTEYLKAAGVGLINRKLAGNSTPEQVFSVRGDKIYVSFHSTFYNQNYIFQLDKEVENLVEKSRQSIFTSYKNGKLTLLMTPLEEGWKKTQEVERSINDLGEHVVIYTCETAVCRRYFARLPELVTLPPLAQ